MSENKRKSRPSVAAREQRNAVLAALTPDLARSMRKRFNLDTEPAALHEDDQQLREIASQLAMLNKKKR